MKFSRIIRQEKKTIRSLFMAMIVAPMLFSYIWTNVYIQNIPFGVVDRDNSALSRTIIAQLKSNPTLNVCYFSQSEDELKNAILDKKVSAGMIIPENFSKDVTLRLSPKTVILSDNTNLTLGGNATSAAATVMSTISAGTQMRMLEGNGVSPSAAVTSLGTFSFTERTLYEPQGGYTPKMIYTTVLMTALLLFTMNYFLPLMLKSRDRLIRHTSPKQTRYIIWDMVKRVTIVGLSVIPATFFGLCAASAFRGLPLRGDLLIYTVSMAAYMLSVVAFGMLCAILTQRMANRNYATQILAMTSVIQYFLSGVTFPFYLMPAPLASIVKMFLPLSNLAVEMKVLNLKGIGWDVALPAICDSLLYTAFWMLVGVIVYAHGIRKERKKNSSMQKDGYTKKLEDECTIGVLS